MFTNLLLNTDSYKASHYLQYPPGTECISSYIEARGGFLDQVLFFGLQAFIKAYLSKPISSEDVREAAAVFETHGVPFNEAGWNRILTAHNGYLPLHISALPEGTVAPAGTALLQVHNSDPELFWLTSYIETALLRAIWYPSTVATVSWRAKQIIRQYLESTAEQEQVEAQLPFKLHDFGARGAASQESAALGGMAHLVNFMGTDTVAGLLAVRQFYGAEMAGFSIPAAEHSTMTAWGRDQEARAYANMIQQFAQPGKLVAVVSDSYDLFHAIDEIWGKQLKQLVRESGATLVVRPDSGRPEVIVPEALERLYAAFGGHVNNKGYRVLQDCIRVIQGDGVDLESMSVILESIKQAGFSTENIAFGMGAGLLQKVDRDTLGFAMKASAAKVQGEWRDVYKQPVTDPGKNSKRGRLATIRVDKGLKTVRESELTAGQENLLRPVFKEGALLVDEHFDVIRERSTKII